MGRVPALQQPSRRRPGRRPLTRRHPVESESRNPDGYGRFQYDRRCHQERQQPIPDGIEGTGDVFDVLPSLPPRPRLALNRDSPQSYQDIRSWVERHVSPGLVDDSRFIDERAWDEAMRMMDEDLRERGVTGRERALAMGDWADRIHEQTFTDNGRHRVPYGPRDRGRLYAWPPTFRGDQRAPAEIFRHGFQPWGDNTDFVDHLALVGDSNYVSTTRDLRTANEFRQDGGYVYVVEDAPGGVDVTMWRRLDEGDWVDEQEVAFQGGIPADKIKGVLIDHDNPSAGIIPNPNFRPREWDSPNS